MMTSSNGNIFHVTGPVWGESTGLRRIPLKRAVTQIFDVFFDLSASAEQMVEQTIETPVIWAAIASIMTSL